MNRDWQDFKSNHTNIAGAREAFENACETLFRKLYPDNHVSQVAVKQGDGGIDIFVGEIGIEPIIVIQCKFFLESFGSSQQSQIRNSFKTAIESTRYELKEWILCIPRVFDIDDNSWWSTWKDKKIKEHGKSSDFIKLKNGNELIDLFKENNIYNQVFKIEDSLKINNIHQKVTELSEYFLPKQNISTETNANIVIFNNYIQVNEPYYQPRPEDCSFVDILKINNLWVYGKSGKGKTTLINRNLMINQIEYLFCDLIPITVNASDDVLNEILFSIEDKFNSTKCDTDTNLIKAICKLLKNSCLQKQIVIVIDELSVKDEKVLKTIFEDFVKLVTHFNNSSNNSSLRFVVSTITEPNSLLDNKEKASSYFEYLCCDNWDSYLAILFDRISLGLNLTIEEKDKLFILDKSNNTPRLLKNIFRKIVTSSDKSSDSIRNLTLLAVKEYF